ncbi:hypothetical protein DVH24_008687 [Malus domestica]|uniref:Pentatricopeptide repeat-containing protein n=1 Tax=Malus domestica TaxID=3750 RepID=A0A498KV07_MALDO|nr:hypothetical protein DVH24_008687 [Malus domestica]
MPEKNIVSYNSLILGLGLHGLASEAFRMFDEILRNGLKPDESTFYALPSACCHAGLVEDGREVFKRMKDEFCIQARTEHYVHMVKLLGMEGRLEEAYYLILSCLSQWTAAYGEPFSCAVIGSQGRWNNISSSGKENQVTPPFGEDRILEEDWGPGDLQFSSCVRAVIIYLQQALGMSGIPSLETIKAPIYGEQMG